ncbi:PQQ-dependent sugar dehydrogenase [Microbacterium sp. NPDC090003]|uniref:PQQ-dependent sugar dehydrogenase n=1 Tax=Microbacterium sp. NPDC090003 TaxID=3364203 RepID=UPI0037FBDA8F
MTLSRTTAAGSLAAILALAGCTVPTPVPTPASAESDAATILTTVVASGLDAPWSIAFHGETALVSERDSARIVEITATGRAREVGRIDGVRAGGEGGLLGIAVHEERLYTYLTADAGDDGATENRIERRDILGAPGSLALGDAVTVIDGIPAAGNHNGGRIAFGPDGMLYATTGDAGDRESAQDPDALSGKILRLTAEGAVPDDNPTPGSPVYTLGHRNPQGIAWADDGTMYASEFGQDTWDELNVIVAGENYGWPTVEGIADRDGFVDPVQQWSPSTASPSGIAMAGDEIVIANLRGERLRIVPLADTGTAFELHGGEYGRLRDAVAAPDGSVWVLTNNTDGRGDPRDGDDRILRVDFG